MKKNRFFEMLLAIVTVFSLLCISVAAEESLISGEWTKGIADTVEEKKDADGMVYYEATLDASYKSPVVNVYPGVKAAIDGKEMVTMTAVFEVRASFSSDFSEEGINAKVTMRGGQVSEEAKAIDQAEFPDLYQGTLFTKIDTANIMSVPVSMPITVTEDWSTVSFVFDVYSEDLSDGIFDAWNLCLTGIAEVDSIASIQFKKVVLTAEEESTPEPTKVPEKTPEATEIPLHKTEAPAVTETPIPTAGIGDSEEKNNTVPYVLIAVGVVIVIGGIAAAVILHKKKNKK